MIGFWISFATGLALLMVALNTLYLFSKLESTGTSVQSRQLSWGIVLTAFSLGANTLYWQVFGQPAVYLEITTIYNLREVGFYLDLLLKGAGIVGLYYTSKALK